MRIRVPGLRAPLNREHFVVSYERMCAALRRRPVAMAPVAKQREVDYAYLGNHHALTRTHRGHKILVDTRDMTITPHLISGGFWEQHVEVVVHRLLRPGQTAAEVGANLGYHTLHMAQKIGSAGKLYAFEANPELGRLLSHSVAMNGYSGIVEFHNVAAADHNGEVTFDYVVTSHGGGHLAVGNPGPGETRVTVPAKRIDDVLVNVRSIDMLRMDAEGSEPLILAGAWQLIDRSPSVIIATEWCSGFMASHRQNAPALAEQLYGRGFKSWLIEHSGKLTPADARTLPDTINDVVFCRQDVQ